MRRSAAAVLLAAALAAAAAAPAAAAPACVPPADLMDSPTAGCCLDQPPEIDPGSSPAFISGVLAHFAYPTSFPSLPADCIDACTDFQAPFTELARSFGAEQVAYVNGPDYHTNAMIIQTNNSVWLVFRGTESSDIVDNIQDAKSNLTEVVFDGTVAGVHSAVYTWASNRGGDERFAEVYRRLGLHDKTLRFSAQGDAVPLILPPALLGYHHVGQLVHVTNGTCNPPDADAEQVDECSLPGLTRTTASEPGLCRDTILPYVESFCDTPFDQLGGKSEEQVSMNKFVWYLLCTGNRDATLFALNNDPSWCCLFEYAYQRVGGVMENLFMQVGLQHYNYLNLADACVASGDAAEQVLNCMMNNHDSAAVFASIEA